MVTVKESDVLYGREVGSGGQATVFEVGKNQVFKKYHADLRPSTASLTDTVRWPGSLDAADRVLIDRMCAWPTSVVTNERGDSVGVLMARIPPPFFVDLRVRHKTITRPRELQYLLNPKKAEGTGIHRPDLPARIEMCRAWARLFALFDAHDLVFGDISMKNLLWSIDPGPGVFLIDCDTAQTGSQTTPSPWTMGWEDPLQGPDEPADAMSDRYKMALVIYRTLIPNPSRRPVADVDIVRRHLPRSLESVGVVDLVVRTAAADRAGRPSALEWCSVLDDIDIGDVAGQPSPQAESDTESRPRKTHPVRPPGRTIDEAVPPPPRQQDRTGRGATPDPEPASAPNTDLTKVLVVLAVILLVVLVIAL